MDERTETHRYPVCLMDSRAAGRIVVDLDSFLRFNAWIDEQLMALEERMADFRRRDPVESRITGNPIE